MRSHRQVSLPVLRLGFLASPEEPEGCVLVVEAGGRFGGADTERPIGGGWARGFGGTEEGGGRKGGAKIKAKAELMCTRTT